MSGPAAGDGTRSLVVVAGGLSQPSSTRLLADRLAEATRVALEAAGIAVEVSTIELRPLAHDITDNLLAGFATPALGGAIDTLRRADGAIVVAPVFTAGLSGLAKSFLDILDPEVLTGMPVLLGATGGSERHSLVLEYGMRPVLSYLRADVVPTGVFAASGDWGDAGLAARIGRAGAQLAERMHASRTPVETDPFAAFLDAQAG